MRSLLVLAGVVLLSTACERPDPIKEKIAALPDLPREMADGLDTLPGTSVLVTKGTRDIPGRPPMDKPSVALPALNCSAVERYRGQIIYPMTVCSPPPWLITDIKEMAFAEDVPAKRRPVDAHYRLRLGPSGYLFCRVTGGPWAAFIDEHTECSGAVWCRLEILGAPTYISYTWSGPVSAAPEAPYLFDVHSTGEFSRSPCSSLSNCGNGTDPPGHL